MKLIARAAMKTLLRLALLLLLAAPAPAFAASSDISMRISVKFILGPGNAMPGGGNGNFNGFDDITNQVSVANAFLRGTGRGYQFQIWENTTVAGDASAFFNLSRDDKEDLEAAAEADPTEFKYRNNAINMYVNNADNSAVCSFPPDDDIILYGQSSRSTSLWHESGHYFNLSHTHTGQDFLNGNGTDCTNKCSCAQVLGGSSDGCADTIADNECWDTQNLIAQGNYGMNYASLSAANQTRVDNIHFNIMSYHDTRDRMTSDQLDRWTDAANGDRNADCTGRTRFVATTGNDATGDGSSGNRFKTLAMGVAVASGGGIDIVLLRAGNYNEPQTITKAVTLRATRGNAVIGLP